MHEQSSCIDEGLATNKNKHTKQALMGIPRAILWGYGVEAGVGALGWMPMWYSCFRCPSPGPRGLARSWAGGWVGCLWLPTYVVRCPRVPLPWPLALGACVCGNEQEESKNSMGDCESKGEEAILAYTTRLNSLRRLILDSQTPCCRE